MPDTYERGVRMDLAGYVIHVITDNGEPLRELTIDRNRNNQPRQTT